MKTKLFLIIAIIFNSWMFCQDSLKVNEQEVRVIAVTPLNYGITKVNGLAVGLGFDPKYLFKDDGLTKIQKVNGLNLEVNPLGLMYLLFYNPPRAQDEELIKVNGLNISSAGYLRGVSHNGVSVSLYNYGHTMNGVMGSLLSFDIEKGRGVFFSTMSVSSKEMKGLSIAPFNGAEVLRGVQIGFYNNNSDGKGLQIGLVNRSKKMKGLQIGFWNKNGKRTLPLINF
ncbi:hypothetical protein NAL32_20050 [Chryseobacterium sp. Ch-15]|uniref:Uncharacterized protein n=1 Tax=Chryseobacterium muglaense TaxID=2893752 RepID=A0A9Q3V0P7_9FLAO|nr:hypothetical protein [Chryseobacterium muglaense]MBD3906976.1 hypothetical protein [Chryseobacterium muglaense]MCC9036410.1 hypothetical protein [Chryseobacterium muglaense]MCM2556690.1 hypothetical protein [Chryseobacterium muglaense]